MRNAAVDKQLRDKYMYSVDVKGDSNCFYRAIFYGLYEKQTCHLQLRTAIAQHLLRNYAKILDLTDVRATDNESIKSFIVIMQTAGTWAGEESILAAADYLQRDIHTYKYGSKGLASPAIYSPKKYSYLFFLINHFMSRVIISLLLSNFDVQASSIPKSFNL